jgi:hypothetical protein
MWPEGQESIARAFRQVSKASRLTSAVRETFPVCSASTRKGRRVGYSGSKAGRLTYYVG